MNLSLSSKSERLFPYFHEIVDDAYFKHVALVSAVNNVPGLSFPSTFSSVFSVAAHAVADPGDLLLQPGAAGRVGRVGRRRARRLEGRRIDRRHRQQLRRAAHVPGWSPASLSKHPGLTPFEVKAVLAAIADNPRQFSAATRTAISTTAATARTSSPYSLIAMRSDIRGSYVRSAKRRPVSPVGASGCVEGVR